MNTIFNGCSPILLLLFELVFLKEIFNEINLEQIKRIETSAFITV